MSLKLSSMHCVLVNVHEVGTTVLCDELNLDRLRKWAERTVLRQHDDPVEGEEEE